ncbi:PREDICTED: fukutin-related protein-like [Acropora digitifera]|uniref:fukutin-related protein-like n=1 Tax=Acropora digitifera TaxID=70779 RepID=UPI00077A4E66|nr:PREDICTED: fukutin-related protein-like [Acropora digitifera]XP_015756137.1 PREDICTED: fukutin-related protein-like [Acropora digitifera]
MQLRKRYLIARLFVFIILATLYVFLNLQNFAYYTNRFWKPVLTCQNSDEEVDLLLKLANQIHMILNSMKIRHWLMYGSIWGALRISRPLPWDNDIDIGFEGEGVFAEMTLSEFFAPFEAAGLKIQNKWTQSGSIVISKPGLWLSVDLFAFYNHKGTMKRRGLESWVFALNYRTYHQFPAWFVKPELPQLKFGFFNISVPKGGIEIMKYLYPYNWWKVVPPNGCEPPH